MEQLFIYLLKSSALMAAFFLSYHLLLRKETFFNSNRWFLLAGLLTSALLPLLFIKKVVFVEPKVFTEITPLQTQAGAGIAQTITPVAEKTDWMQLIAIAYGIVVVALIIKVLFNVFSLFRLLHNKEVQKRERFAFVDLKEDIAPFSFFNFIVFNSSLYTPSEMESILLHEKVHSQQKHSFDVLVARIFCVLFWFNPFSYLYKKAIIQNLEYIADSKAVALIADKRVYQKALLKVVTHQHCLSITNQFYQSLIKKRIVMLNKNQSHKRNSWKYTVVLPVLVAFLVFFQVKVIARELASTAVQDKLVTELAPTDAESIYVTINKNSTDAQMKKSADLLKEKFGIKLKFSKIKRNTQGEITGIKVEFKDQQGNSGVQQFNSKKPIKPIHFFKNGDKIGFGTTQSKVYARNSDSNVSVVVTESQDEEAAPAPEAPIFDEDIVLEVPEIDIVAPLAALRGIGANSRVYIQNDDEEPIVIVDGEVIENGKKVAKRKFSKGGKSYTYTYSDNDGIKGRGLSSEEIIRIKTDALNDAYISMKKMRPEMMAQARKEMEKARVYARAVRPDMEKMRAAMAKDRERVREEMQKARTANRPEIDKARAEMLKAKEEMMQAKAEMEQAKAELEKAQAEMKNKK